MEITKRVEASWKNWKKFSGVGPTHRHNSRMPVKLKEKVYINNSDQPSKAIWGRNMGSTKRKEKRIEMGINGLVGVRSCTQI